MKHCLFAMIALAALASCGMGANGGKKLDGEKMVLEYLQENTNGMDYSILEISELDSLYSPFELLSSLLLRKSERNATLSKQLVEAYDKPTLKERKEAAKEVAKLAYEEYQSFDGTDDIVHSLTDRYFDSRVANRVGYRVKYKVDGKIKEDVFYLERDNSAVGHTASEQLVRYYECIRINDEIYSLKKDAELAARTMR